MTETLGRSAPLVLVVDDAADNREMYGEYLELSGYRTIVASDGAAAVAFARSMRPDVILMDLSLPIMDGWEATRILRADPATAGIPIVAVSGMSVTASQRKSAGFEVVLEKPCDPETLLAVVASILPFGAVVVANA